MGIIYFLVLFETELDIQDVISGKSVVIYFLFQYLEASFSLLFQLLKDVNECETKVSNISAPELFILHHTTTYIRYLGLEQLSCLKDKNNYKYFCNTV